MSRTRRRPHDDSVGFRDDDDTLADLFGGRAARVESRLTRRVRAVIALGVTLALLALLIWGGWRLARALKPAPLPPPETCVARAGGREVHLEHDQMHHAALVAGVAVREGFGERGATIALATALQESSLRNLRHGDRDSLGLFQQRPSQGWGTKEQILDPFYATETFLAAMAKVRWQTGDVNDVAQEVQRSGVPDGYAKRVADAEVLAAVFSGASHDVTCVDRQARPSSSGDFVAELNRTWGVRAVAKGATVDLTGATREIARAWGSFAVANMREYGVVEVQVADRLWVADGAKEAEWTAAPSPLGDKQVRVTFRA